MKITAILLLALCLLVSTSSYSQVTLSEKNLSLPEVFDKIKQQTGYDFLYNTELVLQAGKVDVNLKNASLQETLALCLKDKPLAFSIVDKTVIIEPKSEVQSQAPTPTTIDVRGRVFNEEGKALDGITVLVKGTDRATATDSSGHFLLQNVGKNATLVLTGVNVQPQEVDVDGKSDLQTIAVKTRITSIDEVTVSTGYQTFPKERSAGSYAKPDMKIMKDRSISMNVLQRLDGLVAGLTINNALGANENALFIRGMTTIDSRRNPLYVVDGMALDNVNSINPQDVADITVLKDATAASIWGARASNGVIVITTKKGTSNQKIRVMYDGFVNFQGKPDVDYFPVLSSRQFIQAAREVFDPASFPWNSVSGYNSTSLIGIPPHELVLYNRYRGLISADQANKSLDSLASINNIDQIKDVWYRNAVLMNHTVSLSGGGKMHTFYGSLAYTNNQSYNPGEKNEQFKINLRQDFNFNKTIQAYLITDLTNTITSAKRPITVDNRFYPYQLFQDNNGNSLPINYMGYLTDSILLAFQARSRVELTYNPLEEFNLGRTNSDALMNRIIAGVNLRIVGGLQYEGVFGYIKGNNRTTMYEDTKSYPVRTELVQFTVAANPSTLPVYYLPTSGGRQSIGNTAQRNWTARNQLVYEKEWQQNKHQLILLAGQEAQDQLANTNRTVVRGYNADRLTYASIDYQTLSTTGVAGPVMPNSGSRSILRDNSFNESENQTRFTSYYTNAAYTFNEKYTINGSWRLDKSNLFGKDKSAQTKPVWSVGGKWQLGEEKFASTINWIKQMALRATYGITGNAPSPGSASSYDILLASVGIPAPGLPALPSFVIRTPGNTKLSWERTETINLGLDFSLLDDNRLGGSIDVYRKNTNNLIGQVKANSLTGFNTVAGNFGSIQNKGIELLLNSVNIESNNFTWQSILTLAYNKNEVTQVNTPVPVTSGNGKIATSSVTGYPAFAVFAYQYAGLDSLGDPMIQLSNKTITKARSVATAEDVVFKGTYQPVWSGGFSNLFAYKNFQLAVNAIYNLGHVMRRDVNLFYTGRLVHPAALNFLTTNVAAEFDDRWRQKGDETKTAVPSYVSDPSISSIRRDLNYYRNADINVVDASFIKIRDITFSYTLPRKLLSKINADDISFRMQVSNLMLWKGNKYGIDPEFQTAFSGQRSMRWGQASLTFGAHIGF